MDKKLGKSVRQFFEESMSTYPISMVRDEDAEVPQGSSVFRREHGSRSEFVALIVDPMDDRFTIECAWSEDGKFPAYVLVARPGIDHSTDGRFRFRLTSLWEPSDDAWWCVCENSNEIFADAASELKGLGLSRPVVFSGSVDDSVNDAIDKIAKYAIPYFETMS